MSESTIPIPSQSLAIDPQRRAWGIMLLAFAVFCVMCLIVGLSISYFLFQSTLPLDAIIRMGRGTASVSDQAVQNALTISNGSLISTDPLAQATMTITNPDESSKVIAFITVRRNTALSYVRGIRPRFVWGSIPFSIEIQRFSGEMDIFLPKDLTRELNLSITTQTGDQINLGAGGDYTIRASGTRVQVVNRDGFIVMKPANSTNYRAIPANSQGAIIYNTNPDEILISNTYPNLLSNTDFEGSLVSTEIYTESLQPFSQDWVCSDKSDPPGTLRPGWEDGRLALKIQRDGDATSHGDTGCIRSLGLDGLDVTSYTYLGLRATFKINYQSLSACGQQASECPLMLLIEYRDQNGDLQRWFHGFYYLANPDYIYPLQCNSCQQEHEIVNEKAWFSYDSGNLLDLIAPERPDRRPLSILDVQFYASGHQYDVLIADVALIAGNLEAP